MFLMMPPKCINPSVEKPLPTVDTTEKIKKDVTNVKTDSP